MLRLGLALAILNGMLCTSLAFTAQTAYVSRPNVLQASSVSRQQRCSAWHTTHPLELPKRRQCLPKVRMTAEAEASNDNDLPRSLPSTTTVIRTTLLRKRYGSKKKNPTAKNEAHLTLN